MFTLIAVALASQPTYSGNQATLPAAGVPRQVVSTPTGDRLVTSRGLEHVDAAGFFVRTDLPTQGTPGNTSTPCDTDGNGWGEVFVETSSGPGLFALYDSGTGALVAELDRPPGTNDDTVAYQLTCADVDADGDLEILARTHTQGPRPALPVDTVTVWDAQGVVQFDWVLSNTAIASLEIGQLDADPALEILLPDHRLIDGITGTAQATIPTATRDARLGDFDGDGIDEALARDRAGWTLSTAGTPSWQWTGPGAPLVTDLDGDSTEELWFIEPVLYSCVQRLHSVDPATGTILATHNVPLGSATAFDPDGSGNAVLLFSDEDAVAHVTWDPAAGLQRWKSQVRNRHPIAADFDGDGTEEVLWIQDSVDATCSDRVVLRDSQGGWLDHVVTADTTPAHTSVIDIDGDGDAELLRDDRAWDWSPAAGWTPIALPFQPGPGRIHGIEDVDGDGTLDMLRNDGLALVLHLGNGTITTIAPRTYGNPVLVDLDADGLDEFFLLDSAGLGLFDADGTLLSRRAGLAVLPIETPARTFWLEETAGVPLQLYSWQGGAARLVRDVTPPTSFAGAIAFDAGTFTYWAPQAALTQWTPASGATTTTPTSLDYQVPVAIVGRTAWYPTSDGVRGVQLP